MEIAAEVWSWIGPKEAGMTRFGGEPRRHGGCIKNSYPSTTPEPVGRQTVRCGHSAREPEGRGSVAICAREVGSADCIRHVYPAWRATYRIWSRGHMLRLSCFSLATVRELSGRWAA